jgi:hypothetical protein
MKPLNFLGLLLITVLLNNCKPSDNNSTNINEKGLMLTDSIIFSDRIYSILKDYVSQNTTRKNVFFVVFVEEKSFQTEITIGLSSGYEYLNNIAIPIGYFYVEKHLVVVYIRVIKAFRVNEGFIKRIKQEVDKVVTDKKTYYIQTCKLWKITINDSISIDKNYMIPPTVHIEKIKFR